MEGQKIDLFETLVRFLAVKPLKFEEFDLEAARTIVKKEREGAITFYGEHGYFEEVLEATGKKIAESQLESGTLYIFIKGKGCTERLKRNMIEILMSVKKVIIFGNREDWLIDDSKISYVEPGEMFKENHQRFFVFQSASYNVALVSRHQQSEGEELIEAALSNASDAVGLLAQTVGVHLYHQHNETEI